MLLKDYGTTPVIVFLKNFLLLSLQIERGTLARSSPATGRYAPTLKAKTDSDTGDHFQQAILAEKPHIISE